MNSGEHQRQKAVLLKQQIKLNAAHRREKANSSSSTAPGAPSQQFNVISNMMASNNTLSIKPKNSTLPDDRLPPTPTHHQANSHRFAPSLSPFNDQHQYCLTGVGKSPAIEIDFIMKYLDFVFPFLFPFYRPSLFETGRSWLLVLLGKSKVAYHSAVSLTCYFFTMALTDVERGNENTDCKQLRWEEVKQQTTKCFDSLRTDLLALNLNSGIKAVTNSDKVEILASIIQIIVFEMALGKCVPGNPHLFPAFALVEEVMSSTEASNEGQGDSTFTLVLLEIGQPLWTRRGENRHIWSPEQAGFRFCAGLLVFIDVVASTAFRKAPRLFNYHSEILAHVDDGRPVVDGAEIQLSALFGCRNWVIRSIAEISALDSWKQDQMDTNSLIVVELLERASGIASSLTDSIIELHTESTANASMFLNSCAPFDVRLDTFASSQSTLIWAYAAQLYLHVILHGWQLSDTAIRTNVTQIIALLHTVPEYQLRALVWPLCVAGCMALESEESLFTALFLNRGKVHTAGALDEARHIMEKIWLIRPMLDNTTWNLASCFSILGPPVLLA